MGTSLIAFSLGPVFSTSEKRLKTLPYYFIRP